MCSGSMLVTMQTVERSLVKVPSDSSASTTIQLPSPRLALEPYALITPPLMTVGSSPTPSSSAATMEVVVVLPCVPAMATVHFRQISSASISARRTTGMPSARAASTSGLPDLMADEITSAPAPSICSALWPTKIFAPSFFRRSVLGPSLASEPCTA